MNSSEILDLWRKEVDDTASPFLWSDEEAFSYLDDAQTMFCRKTDGIADATTDAVTRLAVVPTSDALTLHRTVKRIRSARRLDTGRPVEVISEWQMEDRGWWFDQRVGPVRALVIGAEDAKVRVWPVSNETVTIVLTVFRLPLTTITSDGEQTLEIDEQHHRHLMLWMKHLAYSKHDAETFDKRKAEEFEERFLAYCEDVRAEQQRRRHKPRAVAYGGY